MNLDKPNPEKLTMKNNMLYYFGDNSTTWVNTSTKYSEEIVLIFQNVSSESNRDLASYHYPNSSFLGVGYSGHELVVLMHKGREVNETLVKEIYSVIETHSEEHGFKNVPCKFLSMDFEETVSPFRRIWPVNQFGG